MSEQGRGPPDLTGGPDVGARDSTGSRRADELLERRDRLRSTRLHLVELLGDLDREEHRLDTELTELAPDARHDASSLPPEHPAADAGDPATMRPIAVRLLGAFRLFVNGSLAIGGATTHCHAVMLFLASSAPAPVHKERLAAQFWPDADERTSRRNLHQAVYVTRRLLGRHGAATELRFVNDHYSLGTHQTVWRDVDDLERFVEQGRAAERGGDAQRARSAYEHASVIYGGHYLADHPHEDWALAPREYYRRLHREALAKLLSSASARGDHLEVVQIGSQAINLDPSDDDACRNVMHAYSALGEPHLALMAFESLSRVLHDERGMEPTEETAALARRLSGDGFGT